MELNTFFIFDPLLACLLTRTCPCPVVPNTQTPTHLESSVRPPRTERGTSLETSTPLHRETLLHWKCYSSLQSTSHEMLLHWK